MIKFSITRLSVFDSRFETCLYRLFPQRVVFREKSWRLEHRILPRYRARCHIHLPIIALYHEFSISQIARRHSYHHVSILQQPRYNGCIRGSRRLGIRRKPNLRTSVFLGVIPAFARRSGIFLRIHERAVHKIWNRLEWLWIATYPSGTFHGGVVGSRVSSLLLIYCCISVLKTSHLDRQMPWFIYCLKNHNRHMESWICWTCGASSQWSANDGADAVWSSRSGTDLGMGLG